MDRFNIYREPDYGHSSSRSGEQYQTREVAPDSAYSGSSRRGDYRPVSPPGSSRFERPYVPPSITPSRVAERNAPVGVSSFYTRDPYERRQPPPRPNLDRVAGGRYATSSRRSSTSSHDYGGVDLSNLGGGYGVRGYGDMYTTPRRESSSRRRDEPDFSRESYSGSSSRGAPADILGGPFGTYVSRSTGSSRYESSSSSRDYSRTHSLSRYDDLDGAAPRGQSHRSAHSSSRKYRYY